MMFIHLRKVLSGFVVLSALGASAQASVILDGAQLLQQNDMGAYNTPTQYGWGTQGPGSALATAHLAVGPDLATATAVPGNGDLAYTLSYGTTHFILSGDPGYVLDHLGVDLFFNETDSLSHPQITAYDGGAALGDQRDWDGADLAPGVGLTTTLPHHHLGLRYCYAVQLFIRELRVPRSHLRLIRPHRLQQRRRYTRAQHLSSCRRSARARHQAAPVSAVGSDPALRILTLRMVLRDTIEPG
jgi:hypothetical protein